jgi:hypothetical protein
VEAPMPLKSKTFKGDKKLEACLVSDPDHVRLGAQGEHVGKIQAALIILGAGVIGQPELKGMRYGPETARTVLAYKGAPRNIINGAYQNKPDDIVGKMTIGSLDQEMFDFENRPPDPGPTSRFVSLTPAGSPHNHNQCPKETGTNILVNHLGTPINPQGFGRKINIGGEEETKYLGFEDFVTDSNAGGPPRPLTDKIPDSRASDICLRSSPITSRGQIEIRRIAMSHCPFTIATNSFTVPRVFPFLFSIGNIIENIPLVDFTQPDGLGLQIFVIDMKTKP